MNDKTSNDLNLLDLQPLDSTEASLINWGKIVLMCKCLSDQFKIEFTLTDTPESCQDGTKLGGIGVYCIFPKNNIGFKGFSIFEIEFSKIGNLFTFNTPLKNISFMFSDVQIREICSEIKKHGFCFIEHSKLENIYNGVEKGFEHKAWKNRFFSIAV